MPTSNPSEHEKAATGALFLLGSAISFGANPFVGACIGTAAYARMQQRKFGLLQSVAAVWPLVREPIQAALEGLTAGGKEHSGEVLSTILSQTPLLKHFELQLKERLALDGAWLEALVTLNPKTERLRSFGVLGEPGDGKSWLLRYALLKFIRSYPKGRVYIHDIDLELTKKKWGEAAWFGLPEGQVVFSDPHDFELLVKQISNELDDPTDDTPILLVIDEFNNLMPKFSEKTQQRLGLQLEQIKNRGGKRLIQFAIASQAIDVAGLGLRRAFIRSLDWVVLRMASQVGGVYDNLGLRESQKKEFNALVDQLVDLPESIDDFWPCITFIGKQLALTGVPDLSWMPPVLTIISPDEKATSWLLELFEAQPELLYRVQAGEISSRTQFGNILDPMLRAAGEKILKRNSSDSRWKEIAARWDDIVAQKWPPEKPEREAGTDIPDLCIDQPEVSSEIGT
ncbi:MAG TPA: hypothetical protein V6D07_13160 [Trichocoleus sp.]